VRPRGSGGTALPTMMVTVAPGQTLQIYVPREHKTAVEEWVENFRLAREKLEEISTLNRRSC